MTVHRAHCGLRLALVLIGLLVTAGTTFAQKQSFYFTIQNVSDKPIHFASILICVNPTTVEGVRYCEREVRLGSKDYYSQKDYNGSLQLLNITMENRLLAGQTFTSPRLKWEVGAGDLVTSISISGCQPSGDCSSSWSVGGDGPLLVIQDGAMLSQWWGGQTEELARWTFHVR